MRRFRAKAGIGKKVLKRIFWLRSAVRCHFSAQARRKRTISSQKSRSGAVFAMLPLTFVHRRGGFGTFAKNHELLNNFDKPCKIIAPAVGNAPARKSSNSFGLLSVSAQKVGQPRAESTLCLVHGSGLATDAFRTHFGRSSDTFRTPPGPAPGRLPDASRTPN